MEWDGPGILAAVKRKGKTLTALALEAGLHASACRTSIVRPYPKGDRVIASFLGQPLHDLWPDRYRADGTRIDRRFVRHRAQTTPDRHESHRQIAGAR